MPAELYQSGFYVQSATPAECHAGRCRKAGSLCKNEEAGGLTLIDCSDTGSAYGLVIEYGGNRARGRGFRLGRGDTPGAADGRSDAEVVVEVHPPSANSVNVAGVTVEYSPTRPAMG